LIHMRRKEHNEPSNVLFKVVETAKASGSLHCATEVSKGTSAAETPWNDVENEKSTERAPSTKSPKGNKS